MQRYTGWLLAAGVMLAAGTLSASAATPDDQADSVARNVSTAGLDLTKPGDQAMLRHRTAVAASKLCEQMTHTNSITDPGYAACFANAMREARRDIDTRVAAARADGQLASRSPK